MLRKMELQSGTLELPVLDEEAAGLGASIEDVHLGANMDLRPGGRLSEEGNRPAQPRIPISTQYIAVAGMALLLRHAIQGHRWWVVPTSPLMAS